MKLFFDYVRGLLFYQSNGTCASLAGLLATMSRDTLIRFLQNEWSGQKRLEVILATIQMLGGYLLLDDTPIEKPHSRTLEGLQYIYSSSLEKTVYGYCTVTLIWTDGKIRIPIGIRLWRKDKTKITLALELLSYARNQLKLKPKFVVFDSWYAAKVIMKRVKDYGWYFVTRLKKNRKFNGVQLKKAIWRRYWKGTGELSGGLRVFVVKNGGKYFATNRLTLSRSELLDVYAIRAFIEEFHRILKQEFCLNGCQVRSLEAQEHHQWCAVFAFAVLEVEREPLGVTIYKLRENLTRRDSQLSLPYFERLCNGA
jgi:hypothetical protein